MLRLLDAQCPVIDQHVHRVGTVKLTDEPTPPRFGVAYSPYEHTSFRPSLQTPPLSCRDHQPLCLAVLPLCATKCHEVMGGKPRGLCRQATSPWAVAPGGCKPGVKELALKGTGEARGKPPRSQAWLRTHRVSPRSDERPTGNTAPVSRPCLMGQRPHPTR